MMPRDVQKQYGLWLFIGKQAEIIWHFVMNSLLFCNLLYLIVPVPASCHNLFLVSIHPVHN
jgi:hypothetical protein